MFDATELRAFAREQHGVFLDTDALHHGASRAWLSRERRADRVVRLQPRAYLFPDLLDDRSHLMAMTLRCPEAVASHRAAALLWRLDAIAEEVLEVTVPPATRASGRYVHHSGDLAGFEVTIVDSIRCSDPTRTLCDLGAVVDDVVLERATESALRWQLTRVSKLRWRSGVLARPGRSGPAALRRVLDRRPARAPATGSDLETRFLQCIRPHVPEPVRQYPVRLASGGVVKLDDAWPDVRVFAELDGWDSHSRREQFERDRSRQNAVVALGWRPLRFTDRRIRRDPSGVAAECLDALDLAAYPAG